MTFDARKSCADQNFEALSGSNPVNSNGMEISQDLVATDSSRGVGAVLIMPHKTEKVTITTYLFI